MLNIGNFPRKEKIQDGRHEIIDTPVFDDRREIASIITDSWDLGLFLSLGTFYLVKTVLKCIGKALGGSGADMTWLQGGVFGPTVINNFILNGGHYNRCLHAMHLLSEAFQQLLYNKFLK